MSGDLAKDSIDEAVLALLYLNICERPRFGVQIPTYLTAIPTTLDGDSCDT